MAEQEELLTFDDFRERVGASEPSVRTALRALKIEPVPLFNDRRQRRYPASKIEEVQEWIRRNLGGV